MTLRTIVVAFLALSLASSSLAGVGNSRFHAAKCLALQTRCDDYLQRQSGACRKKIASRFQSVKCKIQACQWCRLPGKMSIYPCSTGTLRYICRVYNKKKPTATKRPRPTKKGTPTKKPAPTKKPMPTKSGPAKPGCTWVGDSRIVIDFSKVAPMDGWTRISRGGMTGLVFERSKTHGIVSGGSRGKKCFKVRASMSGTFLLTAITAAPHRTDNNDMWVSSSLGFKLLRDGKFSSVRPGQWTKAYQNKGGNQMADYISTVDFKPHSFIVPNVVAGRTFEICISGRSYKFEVYKLALFKCTGTACGVGQMRSKFKISPSKCV